MDKGGVSSSEDSYIANFYRDYSQHEIDTESEVSRFNFSNNIFNDPINNQGLLNFCEWNLHNNSALYNTVSSNKRVKDRISPHYIDTQTSNPISTQLPNNFFIENTSNNYRFPKFYRRLPSIGNMGEDVHTFILLDPEPKNTQGIKWYYHVEH